MTLYLRPLRGIVVAATLWAALYWTMIAASMLAMLVFGTDKPASVMVGLRDVTPSALGMGATVGAAFGVIMSVLGRRHRLEDLSIVHIRCWGFAAGAAADLVFQVPGVWTLSAGSLYAALCLPLTSAYLAGQMLQMARRSPSAHRSGRAGSAEPVP